MKIIYLASLVLTVGVLWCDAQPLTDLRCVSYVNLEYDISSYVPLDSFTMSYTDPRGGSFDEISGTWTWDYDTVLQYHYLAGYQPPTERARKSFSMAGKLDSARIDRKTGAIWSENMRIYYSYGSAGRLDTTLEQYWNTSTLQWTNTRRETYTYLPSGKLESKTSEGWTMPPSWIFDKRIFYTWDAAGHLVGDSAENWFPSASAWVGDLKAAYSYDGAGNRIEGYYEFWDGTVWANAGKAIRRDFNTHHQPGTVVSMEYSSSTASWDSVYKMTTVFNAAGKPDLYYEEKWNPGAGVWYKHRWAALKRYHYESYLSIDQVDESARVPAAAINIYPVPASDCIYISMPDAGLQTYSATITDISGRLYTSWSGKSAGGQTEVVPVNNLPPGNYLFSMVSKQGRVTKQFSVRH